MAASSRSFTTESSRAAPSYAREAHYNLDEEIVILIILIDAALSLGTLYSLLELYEL